MKKVLLILSATILLGSCNKPNNSNEEEHYNNVINQQRKPIVSPTPIDTVYKIVKNKKEVSEMSTNNPTRYNVWKGKLETVTKVETNTRYFIIYANREVKEVLLNEYLTTEIGDTLIVPIYYK
jgi:PBP1b-binding outer membrane lipoprotein LpoB